MIDGRDLHRRVARLEGRVDALTQQVADLRQRPEPGGDVEAVAEVLAAARGALGEGTWTAAALVSAAQVRSPAAKRLREAIDRAAEPWPDGQARRLGARLARYVGAELSGCVLSRQGRGRAGAVYQIRRVTFESQESQADSDHATTSAAAIGSEPH